jgi:hypothetical protein
VALKGTTPGSSAPKRVTDMNALEAQPWLAERVRSIREHECACDLPLMIEALAVARNIGAGEAGYLQRLIHKLTEEVKP